MNQSACKEWKLLAYLHGELSPQEHGVLKNHVTKCDGCQRELAQLIALESQLALLLSDESMPLSYRSARETPGSAQTGSPAAAVALVITSVCGWNYLRQAPLALYEGMESICWAVHYLLERGGYWLLESFDKLHLSW